MTGYFCRALLTASGATVLALVGVGSAQAATFRGIEFPEGAVSFADAAISYDRGGDDGNYSYAPLEVFNRPETALGEPNSVLIPENESQGDFSARDDLSLGEAGQVVLRFTDNFLTGSGDSEDDMWIFEAGTAVEGVLVEISADGVNWSGVGQIGGTQIGGIDLDAFGFDEGDLFSYVRLTDDGNNVYRGGWSGADIDSVGAISTVAVDVPEPGNILGLLAIGAFTIGSRLKRKA
ncbi:MAG: PEP-CTERM sorting domain-containing protein [Microcoleaceae cyanobacterium]